jgi:hypothetical protein
MTDESTVRRARASPLGVAVARAGLASRAIVYTTLAVLVAQLATGERRGNTDQGTGLQVLGRSGAGTVALLVLVAGVACYSLWRFSTARTSSESTSDRWLAVVEGATYLPIGYMAISVLAGDDAAASQGPRYRTLSARIMQESAGRWLIGVVGVGVIVIGLFLASQGVRTSFLDDMRIPARPPHLRAFVAVVGGVGSIGRGIVFGLAGVLVVYAAVTARPSRTGGIDAALDTVRAAPYGRVLLLAAAAAFAAFALLALFEAAWREVAAESPDAG